MKDNMETFFRCEKCNKLADLELSSNVLNGVYLCEDCLSFKLCLCIVCNQLFEKGDKRICNRQCAPFACIPKTMHCLICEEYIDELDQIYKIEYEDEKGYFGKCVDCFIDTYSICKE